MYISCGTAADLASGTMSNCACSVDCSFPVLLREMLSGLCVLSSMSLVQACPHCASYQAFDGKLGHALAAGRVGTSEPGAAESHNSRSFEVKLRNIFST